MPVPPSRSRGGGPPFCCFGCRFAHELLKPVSDGETGSRRAGMLLVRLGLGIFLALNIMVFSWIFYSREFFGPVAARGAGAASLADLFAYLLMFLCTCVIVLLGFPLFGDALDGLRRSRRIDANLLISIGVGSAFVLSVGNTLRGAGSLYYDTAAVVLVLVTLGHYLEASSRRRATSAAAALLDVLPRRVWVRRGEAVEEIDVSRLAPGEHLRVRAGEAIAGDGTVVEGTARVESSRLTGESRPRTVGPGDTVLAGAVSLDGELWVEVQRAGDRSVLARVRRLLEDAGAGQPRIQRLVDRVAAVFVPGVVALAVGVFVWHAVAGQATRGLLDGLSVLLISCPCALGVAAPLASWAALHRAASRGIVFDAAVTLERAARIAEVIFDKTGTLTDPEPTLLQVVTTEGVAREDALRLAAAVEGASLHPIARTLIEMARREGLPTRLVTGTRTLPGIGIEGDVDGRRIRLGSRAVLPGTEGPAHRPEDEVSTSVYLVEGERPLARFDLVETPRADAEAAIHDLRSLGVGVRAATGDDGPAAGRLESRLGIPVEHSLLPEDKLRRLQELRRETGKAVGMVGDGINDAPVLAAADVGFAVTAATDLARHAGAVHLLADRLTDVPRAIRIARHAVRRIRLNLGWAFGYNTVGIALAAAGMLSPVFAGTSMILSSLIVTTIARGAGAVDDDQAAGYDPPAGVAARPPIEAREGS